MGRPEKPIDWDLVDQLLMSGCKGTEIASHFGIHQETLYDRVVKEYGMTYTDYSYSLQQKGESLLRHEQFCKALGIKKDGDNTMLIWLGKNRLGQREHEETSQIPPLQAQITSDHENMLLKAEMARLKEKIKPMDQNDQ